MKRLFCTALFILTISAHAFQCGPFTVLPDRYRTTISGDLQQVTGITFQGDQRDYRWATITLLPQAITSTDRQYRLIAQGGRAQLEVMTTESPPRILNREECNAGLEAFSGR